MNEMPSAPFSAFLLPSAEFRPAVLWSWNGAMSDGRICESVRGFAERNIGGVYIHPRPGLITEYLSEEWFRLWGVALEECRRHGIACHIYDENSFPSGFAGGHVVAANPLAATSRLTARPPGTKPTGVRMGRLDPADPDSPALDLEKFPSDLWQGGFALTDVCRSEVTAQFLKATHAEYAARFSDAFGGSLRHVFTDEPETGTSDRGFHMSRAFLREFVAEHGYPLESRLPDLCGTNPESPAVRHDYFLTLNRLFTYNFARRCGDWCEANGLVFTGHFLENQWPSPAGCPSTMSAMRWMQAPGVDMLGFQFKPGPIGDNALWLLTVKEATSVAAQCGRDEVLCESCGGGGYEYGPADMKPLEDFLLALGLNRIVPHLAHQSLAGARKYDWPQTISDHSPWWDAYAAHALHVARTNYLLSQGTETNPVLVLHPTTTGWLHYRPACFHRPGEDGHGSLDDLRDSHARLLAGLYSAGVGFDLGDEIVMAEICKGTEGTKRTNGTGAPALVIGARAYETVVVPPGMQNMLSSTVRLLREFLEAGGRVLLVGDGPAFVDGRPAGCEVLSGSERVGDVSARLLALHPPHLAAPGGSPLPADLLRTRRALPDGGDIVFFANPTNSPITAEVAVGSGVELDTFTGMRTDLACDGGRVCLTLPPAGHALWHLNPDRAPRTAPASKSAGRPVDLEFLGCEPLEPNVLPLIYCNYDGPGVSLRGVPTIAADTANWHAQGFDQNLWRVSIQFRRTFLDAAIPENSGFTVGFPFEIAAGFADADISAAIERPWLYSIFCNGLPVPQDDPPQWFDEETRLLALGRAVRPGKNLLELRADKFHVLAEIAPVVLRGRFAARSSLRGFVLEPPAPIDPSADWASAGYPFYPWTVRYRFAFSCDSASRVRAVLPEFAGSAIGLSLDGAAPVWRSRPIHEIVFPDPARPSPHRLDILLAGNLKNLMGPHFSDGLPGAWSWEEAPASPPPGDAFRLARTALDASPNVFLENLKG